MHFRILVVLLVLACGTLASAAEDAGPRGPLVVTDGEAVIGLFAEFITDTTCMNLRTTGAWVTLWLSNAVNPDYGNTGPRDVRNVGGFDLALTAHPSAVILAVEYPIAATNSGSGDEYLIRYAVPQTVFADQTLILARFLVGLEPAATAPDQCALSAEYLGVTGAPAGIVPGQVAFIDADDPIDPAVVAAPGYVRRLYHSDAVATDAATWGGVKTLYR